MKIIFTLFLLFVNCSAECDLNPKKVFDAAKPIVEWMANGYLINLEPNKNGLIYGECLSRIFGVTGTSCLAKNATAIILLQCVEVFKAGNFEKIASQLNKAALTSIYNFIRISLNDKSIFSDYLCTHLTEYIQARIRASEGGRFEKTKMEDYCRPNERQCKEWANFIADKTGYLKWFVTEIRKKKNLPYNFLFNNENAIQEAVKLSVDYAIQDKWAKELVKPCLVEFFELLMEKMGSFNN